MKSGVKPAQQPRRVGSGWVGELDGHDWPIWVVRLIKPVWIVGSTQPRLYEFPNWSGSA